MKPGTKLTEPRPREKPKGILYPEIGQTELNPHEEGGHRQVFVLEGATMEGDNGPGNQGTELPVDWEGYKHETCKVGKK